MGLIDFELDAYDYATFALLIVLVLVFFYAMITLGGLPGKLAERRNHPHAESVKLGGWIGLFTVFPWIHALIWAYHDSMTVDVRKFPGGPKPAAGDEPTERLEVQRVPADQAPAEPVSAAVPEKDAPPAENKPGEDRGGASA